MNDSTLTAIDALVDKNNRPIVRPAYNAEGERLLLDYPVKICPSFDSIGSGKKPVAFGALDYFIFRLAEKGTDLQIMMERYAEYGQIGYQARLRGNGVLLGVGQDVSSPVTFTSPVKYLQNEA
jgi:HK97 family phage major capsid protein